MSWKDVVLGIKKLWDLTNQPYLLKKPITLIWAHKKNGQKLSILKRLFNRDPNIGLLQSPQNWVVKSKKSPVYPKQLVVLVIAHLSLE